MACGWSAVGVKAESSLNAGTAPQRIPAAGRGQMADPHRPGCGLACAVAEIALECRPLEVLADERLAAMAAAGGDRAFAVLYLRYQAPLRRYCVGLLRAGSDAEDVVQTTMARALAGLHSRRDNGSWRAWLYRIARNESLEVLRRRRPTADLHAVEYIGP